MQKWYNIHNEIFPKEDTAMKRPIRATALLMTLLFMLTGLAALPVAAAEDAVLLGDRKDLFLGRDSLDEFGWNTAHSGEPITIGSQRFDKGLGFHCLPDRDAYCEFDISSLNLKYFAASVGVLKEASYFIEWGSISFHVYGDGKLLASTPMRVWGDEPYFLSCSVEGVKTLRLVQKNENGHACDAGVWGNARLTNEKPEEDDQVEVEPVFDPNKTTKPQPAELVSGDYAYISDLYWLDTKTYTGNVVGRDCNTANEIIFSNDGKFFEKGVGFHAVSGNYDAYLDINIEGLGFTKLAAYYGVCETLTSHDISMAQVKFAVFGDGAKLWESGTMKFGEDMLPMECDITGVKTLRLAVAGAPGISGAWGTYGGAILSKSGEITDDLLFSEFSFDEPVPDTPATDPETPAETDPVTDPVTEPDTTSEPETPAPTEPAVTTAPEATAPSDTEPEGKGCGSALGMTAWGITAAACAAVALKKRKED
jgi:hypothetical protein